MKTSSLAVVLYVEVYMNYYLYYPYFLNNLGEF
jgi:hypothetical protein